LPVIRALAAHKKHAVRLNDFSLLETPSCLSYFHYQGSLTRSMKK
jgi:hypothetical protein